MEIFWTPYLYHNVTYGQTTMVNITARSRAHVCYKFIKFNDEGISKRTGAVLLVHYCFAFLELALMIFGNICHTDL